MRPKRPWEGRFIGEGTLLEDERDDEGDVFVLDFPAMALSVVRAFEEDVLERTVAVPLTSLSVSSVGSRLTNSFCSNWTTTYGRARMEDTLRLRADMSLTWICPLDVDDGAGVFGVPEDVPEEVDDGDDELGLLPIEAEGC